MGLNDGFLETFIFRIKRDIYTYETFKVVINFTKGICTVYDDTGITRNGKIMLRMEKLSRMEMNQIKKQINDYIEGKCNQLPNFNRFKPNRRFRVI